MKVYTYFLFCCVLINTLYHCCCLDITIGYSNKVTHTIQQGTDAYQKVQQSLNDLRTKGGGTLYFESGVYLLSSNIEVGNNTAIIGAGINNTILKLVDKAAPWWIPNIGLRKSGLIRSKGTVNLYFANFTIDGNKNNQNTDEYSAYGRFGLYTEATDNVVVDGMGVVNFQGYGFDPHGVKEPKKWSRGLIIVNSYSANNDWDGYTIDQSTDVFLQNNIAYNNGRHGFNFVTGTYNVIMYNNLALNNGFSFYLGNPGCGVAVQNNLDFGTRNISIFKNIFQDDYDAGICVRDVADITLKDNVVVNVNYTDTSTHLCIEVFNTTNVVSENNICNNQLKNPYKQLPLVQMLPTPTEVIKVTSSPLQAVSPMQRSNSRKSKSLSPLMIMVIVVITIWIV